MGVGARGANSEVEADGAKYEVDADAMYEYEYGNQNTPTDRSTVVRTVAAFSNLQ